LEDLRPDYQDLLIDLTLWVWLRPGTDSASPPLSARVPTALENPVMITRSGGLSLGESSYLVDVVRVDQSPPNQLTFLMPDPSGFYSLPVWVDHIERANTVLERFRLSEPIAINAGLGTAWIRIGGKS
jgi:CRISPR-associated protein Cas5t